MRKGTTSRKLRFFCHFSNCHHFKASRAPGFPYCAQQASHLVYKQFGPSMSQTQH